MKRNPVVCQNSADRLGGPPFIVVEDSAHPFVVLNSRIHVDHTVRLLDQRIMTSIGGDIERRERLGGMLNYYHRRAA